MSLNISFIAGGGGGGYVVETNKVSKECYLIRQHNAKYKSSLKLSFSSKGQIFIYLIMHFNTFLLQNIVSVHE